MRTLIAAAFLLTSVLAGPAAADATIRLYPKGPQQAYPLDSVRGVQSLVLHNTAVINTTRTPLTVGEVRFELLRGGHVIETRVLSGIDIDRFAKTGAGAQAAGMIEGVGFQFGDVLGRAPARLPGVPTLQPGEGLLVTSQVLSWTGKRDQLRITMIPTGEGGDPASLTVPIRNEQPEPRYLFPLKGRFYVQAGPSLNTHHRWAVPEEFALDIAEIGEGGLSFRRDGRTFIDYLAYGQPVYAAADGEVVKVVSTMAEDPAQFRRADESQDAYFQRLQAWQATMMADGAEALAGNVVVIKHPWGEYSVYAHLKPGSPTVRVGQRVAAGEMIARLGSSGSSTEPHLHFHVCDGPTAIQCVGKPASFLNIENPFALTPGAIQSGDIVVTR